MRASPPSPHLGATTVLPFRDRADAGQRLANRLSHLRSERPVVIGLARGGVMVAAEVAKALDAPLDVLVVKKVGAPWQPEVALGAVAPDAVIMNDRTADAMHVSRRYLSLGMARAASEVQDREQLYHGRRAAVSLEGRTVVLVDDGLATGATAAVAVASVRKHQPAKVVVAAPVGSLDATLYLETLADEVVCLTSPTPFESVGEWYEHFDQVPDEAVLEVLQRGSPAGAP